MTAHYTTHGPVAVITLDNPPVNGLGWAVRHALVQALEQAQADAAIQAMVLTGAGRAFSGGADIREFGQPAAMQEPRLPQVIAALEASTKPVVAALHSVSMGGGLELALGCHYRIAAPGCRVALPEVKLGLLPGSGGTQRLPRALGVAAALEIVVNGASHASEALFALPGQQLFDRLAASPQTLLEEALELARSVAGQRPLPLLRHRSCADPEAAQAIAAMRAQLQRRSKNLQAPFKCVDAIEAATRQPVETGQPYERELFLAQVQSAESRALRHLFLAERAAGKIAALPPDTVARPVRQAALVAADGAQVALEDWALRLTRAGLAVSTLYASQADAQDYSALQQADLVLLLGDAAALQPLLAHARAGAILVAARGSLLPQLVAHSQRPQDCVGLRRWGGVLEVLRHPGTGADVLASMQALGKQMRVTAITTLQTDAPAVAVEKGVAQYLLAQHQQQVAQLREQGHSAEDIQQALHALGFGVPVLPPSVQGSAAQPDPMAAPVASQVVQAWVEASSALLAQGVADKASDLNLLCVRGLGFPAHLGGPLQYASERAAVV